MANDDDDVPPFTDPNPGQVILAVCPAERWPVSGWRRATRTDLLRAIAAKRMHVISFELYSALGEFWERAAPEGAAEPLLDALSELFDT